MRAKLFFLFVTLSTLACMQQVNNVSITAIPAKISAQPIPSASPALKNELQNSPNPTETVKTTSARVTALETVYIRADHDYRADVVGYLMNGEDVNIYECFGIWARVDVGKWVNSLYLSRQCP